MCVHNATGKKIPPLPTSIFFAQSSCLLGLGLGLLWLLETRFVLDVVVNEVDGIRCQYPIPVGIQGRLSRFRKLSNLHVFGICLRCHHGDRLSVFLAIVLLHLLFEVFRIVSSAESGVFVAQLINDGRGHRWVLQCGCECAGFNCHACCVHVAVCDDRLFFQWPRDFDVQAGNIASESWELAVLTSLGVGPSGISVLDNDVLHLSSLCVFQRNDVSDIVEGHGEGLWLGITGVSHPVFGPFGNDHIGLIEEQQ